MQACPEPCTQLLTQARPCPRGAHDGQHPEYEVRLSASPAGTHPLLCGHTSSLQPASRCPPRQPKPQEPPGIPQGQRLRTGRPRPGGSRPAPPSPAHAAPGRHAKGAGGAQGRADEQRQWQLQRQPWQQQRQQLRWKQQQGRRQRQQHWCHLHRDHLLRVLIRLPLRGHLTVGQGQLPLPPQRGLGQRLTHHHKVRPHLPILCLPRVRDLPMGSASPMSSASPLARTLKNMDRARLHLW